MYSHAQGNNPLHISEFRIVINLVTVHKNGLTALDVSVFLKNSGVAGHIQCQTGCDDISDIMSDSKQVDLDRCRCLMVILL